MLSLHFPKPNKRNILIGIQRKRKAKTEMRLKLLRRVVVERSVCLCVYLYRERNESGGCRLVRRSRLQINDKYREDGLKLQMFTDLQ